jgi:hypothetical protein
LLLATSLKLGLLIVIAEAQLVGWLNNKCSNFALRSRAHCILSSLKNFEQLIACFSPTLWQFIERIQLLLCLTSFALRWLSLALWLVWCPDSLTFLIVLIFFHLWRIDFVKLLKLLFSQCFGSSLIVIPSIIVCLLLYALINSTAAAPSWTIDRLLLGLECLFDTVWFDSLS